MRITIQLVAACWLAVTATAANTETIQATPSAAASQVEIRYETLKRSITLHEPVVISFRVHNRSSNRVTLTLGAQNREFFEFSLTTPDGRVVQGSPLSSASIATVGSGLQTVEAAGDYQQQLLMNQWFRFDVPGTYLLTASLSTPV